MEGEKGKFNWRRLKSSYIKKSTIENKANNNHYYKGGKKEANQFEQIHEILRDDLLLKPFLCTIKETV